jgi:hypothetical protein
MPAPKAAPGAIDGASCANATVERLAVASAAATTAAVNFPMTLCSFRISAGALIHQYMNGETILFVTQEQRAVVR